MTSKLINANFSEVLFEAYESRQSISIENMQEVQDKLTAYAIQQQVTEKKKIVNNDPPIGYKISLTSEETQKMFDSTTPLYGAFTASNVVEKLIELDDMISPLIEMELIFIVNEELSSEDSEASILRKTKIVPGLEIPDSRFTNWFPNLSLYQVISDSAVAGKILIGQTTNQPTLDQLTNIKGTLRFNGEVIATGNSSEVLGNPIHAVKWLIDELASHGKTLRKGSIISSGTFILPKVLEKGIYEAEFEGVGEALLTVV